MMTIDNRSRFSRRAFLGWFISIGGAATVVTGLAAWEGVMSNLPSLFSWRSKRRRIPGHDRAKLRRIARHSQPRSLFEESVNLVLVRDSSKISIRSSVVHWPHPRLFAAHLPKRGNHRVLLGDDWKRIVQPRCVAGKTKRAGSTTHFYPPHEGLIREQLALNEVTFRTDSIEGTSKALEILRPALEDNRQRYNWRLYHLYGRLICCEEADPTKAYKRVLNDAWARPEAEHIPKELFFLSDIASFESFHAKARTSSFQKQLKKRVEFAVSLRRSQSSSGQDTAVWAERVRSNRPRLQSNVRRAKLARRSKRRGMGKRDSFWHRITVLWKRASLTPNSNELTTEKPHLTTAQRLRHLKIRSFVSPRLESCIPTRRQSRSAGRAAILERHSRLREE